MLFPEVSNQQQLDAREGSICHFSVHQRASFMCTFIMSFCFCSVLTPVAQHRPPPTVTSAAARERLHLIIPSLQPTSSCNAIKKAQNFISNLFFPVSTCCKAQPPTSGALSLLLPPKALQWRSSGSVGSLEQFTAQLGIMKCGKKAGFKIRACNRADSAADEWVKLLPDKKAALYSHSLPCIEAWLRTIGFRQSKDDRATWIIERPDWHAQLSLDITDLYIRYLKSGPGKLDRDVERKFSYALCREDLENAILGGP